MLEKEIIKEKLSKMDKDELVEYATNLAYNNELYLEALKDLRNKKYKATSENSDNMQLSLFNEIEDTIDHSDDNDLKETITYNRSKKKKSKVDYSNLEVKTIHHNLKDLNCPNCNSKLKELKEDIYETLVYKPAEYYIEKHIVHNYVCNKCSKETDSLVSFKASDIPNKLINKSLASSSVISNIAYNKFILDIPLYRQETDLKRRGINISRQNMSNWLMIASNDYLEYIFNKMHEDIKKCKYLHADETTLTVIEDKKLEGREKSYEWLLLTGKQENNQMALYFYNHSREYAFLDLILGDYSSYLHSDGYGAYQNKKFTNVACLAHVRRKFIDAYNTSILKTKYEKATKDEKLKIISENPSFSNVLKVINIINEIFTIDKKSKDINKRYELRLTKSKELFKSLELLNGRYALKTKMGLAITYTLNLKEEILNILKDPNLEISNNLAEQKIKPFVMARKNFLFSNTKSGAKVSSIYFSLIESAKMNKLNPYKYLVYALDILNTKGLSNEVIESVLPYSKTLPTSLYVK